MNDPSGGINHSWQCHIKNTHVATHEGNCKASCKSAHAVLCKNACAVPCESAYVILLIKAPSTLSKGVAVRKGIQPWKQYQIKLEFGAPQPACRLWSHAPNYASIDNIH